MSSINNDFRRRYLNVHEPYLDAIWAITVPSGDGKVIRRIDIPSSLIEELKESGQADESRSIRAMRNAWYHECAFFFTENNEEWLKFPPWRIIQFYYSVYCMLSAMVRCVDNTPRLAHQTMINKFTEGFVMDDRLSQVLFFAPFCFYVDNEGNVCPEPAYRISRTYALENDFPTLCQCLKNVPNRSNKPISVFHYFKLLREWTNYEDSYIFINLYGPSVRDKLKHCLQHILPAFLTIGENFLVAFWGADKIRAELQIFTSKMVSIIGYSPSTIQARFDEYGYW
jgi:hypothetical protein